MTVNGIERSFREKVSASVRVASEGLDRYRVFTPFLFEDGDHLAIVLRRRGKKWTLSDEGHTYMHLTYDMEEKDFRQGTRQKIISNALSMFSVVDQDGELLLEVEDDQYGDALYTFVQVLLKIADVSFLSRERVRSSFIEDFRAFMSESVPAARMKFDWSDPVHDPQGMYRVDCRVNGMARPLMVFALPSDDKTRDSTIALLQFEKWSISHRSVAIFEDQESITRRVLARFTDVCERQYSSLNANKERIRRFLDDAMAQV